MTSSVMEGSVAPPMVESSEKVETTTYPDGTILRTKETVMSDGSKVVVNETTDPDGVMTVDKIVEPGTGASVCDGTVGQEQAMSMEEKIEAGQLPSDESGKAQEKANTTQSKAAFWDRRKVTIALIVLFFIAVVAVIAGTVAASKRKSNQGGGAPEGVTPTSSPTTLDPCDDKTCEWNQFGSALIGADYGGVAGASTALSADSSILAVGGPGNEINGGLAQVYIRDGTSWSELGAPIQGVDIGGRFGLSVDLSNDGSTLVVGGRSDSESNGVVRVYRFVFQQIQVWTQLGSDLQGGAMSEGTALPVSMSSDGNVIAFGLIETSSIGRTRVFAWSGDTWEQRGDDIESNFASTHLPINLSGSGSVIVIGSPDGAFASVYDWDGEVWNPRGVPRVGNSDSNFGASVKLNDAGDIVAIGADFVSSSGLPPDDLTPTFPSESGTAAPVASVEGTPFPVIQDTPIPAMPDMSVPGMEDTSIPAMPDMSIPGMPAMQDTSSPAMPDTPFPPMQDTSFPALYPVTPAPTATALDFGTVPPFPFTTSPPFPFTTSPPFPLSTSPPFPVSAPGPSLAEPTPAPPPLSRPGFGEREDPPAPGTVLNPEPTFYPTEEPLAEPFVPLPVPEPIAFPAVTSAPVGEPIAEPLIPVPQPITVLNPEPTFYPTFYPTEEPPAEPFVPLPVPQPISIPEAAPVPVKEPVIDSLIPIPIPEPITVPAPTEPAIDSLIPIPIPEPITIPAPTEPVIDSLIPIPIPEPITIPAPTSAPVQEPLLDLLIPVPAPTGLLIPVPVPAPTDLLIPVPAPTDLLIPVPATTDLLIPVPATTFSFSYDQPLRRRQLNARKRYRYTQSNVQSVDDRGRRLKASPEGKDGESPKGLTRVFRWNGSSWEQLGIDLVSGGDAIGLSSNGLVLAVGASGAGEEPSSTTVYSWNGVMWTRRGNIISGETASTDVSSLSIDVSSDGNSVAIGEPNVGDSGQVSVFDLSISELAAISTESPTSEPTQEPTVLVNILPTSASPTTLRPTGQPTLRQTAAPVAPTAPPTPMPTLDKCSVNVCFWKKFNDLIVGQTDNEFSGTSVSFSKDGTSLAVGGMGSTNNNGFVRVYNYDGLAWTPRGLPLQGLTEGEHFGISVALSDDGSMLAVGADAYDVGADTNRGILRVYRYVNLLGEWVRLGRDLIGDAAFDLAGWSVALSAAGDVVAFSAPESQRGYTRIFIWDETAAGGGDWVQRGNDIELGRGHAGHSISMNDPGTRIVIGNPDRDTVGVFEWRGESSSWQQVGENLDGRSGTGFGQSVSMSGSGHAVAIGAPFEGDTRKGYASMYSWDGSKWNQNGTDILGVADGDHTGSAVSLSKNGDTVAIGSAGIRGDSQWTTRVYALVGDQWAFVDRTLVGDSDSFGSSGRPNFSAALSGNGKFVAVGSSRNDEAGRDRGKTVVYGWGL